MIKKYLTVIVLVLVTIMILFTGCVGVAREPVNNINDSCIIKSYSNNVVYFGCDEELFIQSLSDYIDKNNVRVTSIGSIPDREYHNVVRGYVVVIEKR